MGIRLSSEVLRVGPKQELLLYKAVQRSAREMHVSLLAFVGKALKAPYGNDIEQNFVYSFINNETVDGLITIASVGVFVSSQDCEMFVNHFSGLPPVSLSVKCGKVPAVLVDCKQGMREAVEHSILDHNYKRMSLLQQMMIWLWVLLKLFRSWD